MLRVAPGFDAALARMAREFLAHGETNLKVTLDPPRLGALEVRLTVSETHASARIVAASPEAANLLAREREDLVRAFQEQGFGSVSVEIGSGEGSRGFSRGRDEGTEDGKGAGVPAPRNAELLRAKAPAVARAGGLDLFV
jgi:flagellar hook-length control protein FliK